MIWRTEMSERQYLFLNFLVQWFFLKDIFNSLHAVPDARDAAISEA